jgi:hypothetical protein
LGATGQESINWEMICHLSDFSRKVMHAFPTHQWTTPRIEITVESWKTTYGVYQVYQSWGFGSKNQWLRSNLPFTCFLYKNYACIPYSQLLLWFTPQIDVTSKSR